MGSRNGKQNFMPKSPAAEKKKEEFDLKTRTAGVSGSPHPHLHSDLLKMPNWTVHAPGPKIWHF